LVSTRIQGRCRFSAASQRLSGLIGSAVQQLIVGDRGSGAPEAPARPAGTAGLQPGQRSSAPGLGSQHRVYAARAEPPDPASQFAGTAAALGSDNTKGADIMNTLDPETLDHVNGGVVASRTTSSTSITDSLNTLNTQLTALTNNNNNNNNNPNSMNSLLPFAMFAMMRNQRPTVISGGTVVA
jgi:hypothetical protein